MNEVPAEVSGGSKIQLAAWLARVVGEGGVFTKQEMRSQFPTVEQIDRRMRDLRELGWRIDEARVALDLEPNQLRLVKIGVRIWIPAERNAAKAKAGAISARTRTEVFERDGHACVRCGIAAGDEFPDQLGTFARMTAAHIYPNKLGGKATASDLVTACQLCNEALREQTPNYLDGPQVQSRARSLGKADRERLLSRMRTGRAEADKVDAVYRAFRQLPGVEREQVQRAVEESLG